MNKNDWRILQVVSAGIALVVALHGITNKKWEQAHTVGTILGVAGTIGPELFG